jgi:hypothetical protein
MDKTKVEMPTAAELMLTLPHAVRVHADRATAEQDNLALAAEALRYIVIGLAYLGECLDPEQIGHRGGR